MANRLTVYEVSSVRPHHNLAIEKFLFDSVAEDELILYLWQNESTIVCGRNQNVYKECHLTKLYEVGGTLARRLSGGGAVFHDLGNLNFTFIAKDGVYNLEKQLSVITEACKSLGVPAELTGRNDILAGGRKFSGNAFYSSKGTRYHHGTLMVNVDFSRLSDYLNVDRAKLQAKGVDSVRSRVANLTEFSDKVTISSLKAALIASLGKIYDLTPRSYQLDEGCAEIAEYEKLFSSEDWLYGRKMSFNNEFGKRYAWGDFQLRAEVAGGIIKDAVIFSDALDAEMILTLAERFKGTKYLAPDLCAVVAEVCREAQQREDIVGLIKDSI